MIKCLFTSRASKSSGWENLLCGGAFSNFVPLQAMYCKAHRTTQDTANAVFVLRTLRRVRGAESLRPQVAKKEIGTHKECLSLFW